MTYSVSIQPKLSLNNSNAYALAGGATYTGAWEECWNYGSISTLVSTDVAGTLYVDFSTDGANTDRAVLMSSGTATDISSLHMTVPITKYFRVRLVNGASPQSYMRLQTLLNPEARISIPTSRMAQSVGDYTDVLTSKSVLVGKTEGGGVYTAVSVEGEGHLEVAVQGPTTAFGEMAVAQRTPVGQVDFVYGENPRMVSNTKSANGVVTTVNAMISVTATANTNSFAQAHTRRYLKYRPGQGAMGRFTALFTTGVAGANQYAGLATSSLSDGFMFGYRGADFGIWHLRGNTRTFIAKADWNVDRLDGAANSTNKTGMTLDPTKGNVYQIQYQYLGFGNILFSVENPANGQLQTVHEIVYPNAYVIPSLLQPSMETVWRAENATNNTELTVRGASAAMFVEGERVYFGPRNAVNNNKTAITTETNILTIKNATTFNGRENKALARMRNLTFAGNASGGAAAGITTLRIIRNATLGGTPSWTQVDGTSGDSGATVTGQSTISYDTAGTTVTGGTVVYNEVTATGSGISNDITELDITLLPGETLTFAVSATAAVTTGVGIVWNEDI